MPAPEVTAETMEYLLVLVLPKPRKVLAISCANGYRLPTISIPQWTRPAEQLQKAIWMAWRVHALILEFLHGASLCAVAEVLVYAKPLGLEPVALHQLHTSELSEHQRAQIASILAGNGCTNSPFSQIGWIDEAITWLESETGEKLSSKKDVEQFNAGGAFALVRFRIENDRDYWLKATGHPNAHELPITMLLSKLCGDYLPELISSNPTWNAWLTLGGGTSATEIPEAPFEAFTLLEGAVQCMARLQMQTRGHSLDLLGAGAFDQSVRVFQTRIAEIFDYLDEVMNLQISTKAPRLEKKRIHDIRTIFEMVCQRVEDLGIGETIVHGDMNRGNILIASGHCTFIDWSEAYIGNPLIALQYLLLLNNVENMELRHFINLALKQRYLDAWAASCDPVALHEGFVYMSLLAAASTLYGRGDWLTSPQRNDPRRQSYARTLARRMDRAAQDPQLLEALCR